MSKYDPFETVEEKIQKHLIIGMLVFAFILAAATTLMVHVLEQHHEMERATNKKLYGRR